MRCGIMLQKCHKHLVYGRVGESAEQNAAPRAPYDLGNDSRFPRAGWAPNEVEHFAVRGAADGFDLAGVELREPPRLAFGSAPLLTQEAWRDSQWAAAPGWFPAPPSSSHPSGRRESRRGLCGSLPP